MISVIVPVYNVESYLHQCIESILNQTYQDIELLLIDDGSADKCGKICEEYARIDNRIRLFHTDNRGLSAARNLGLQEAKGDYIGFVDSDDYMESHMYEILLQRLKETRADISTCEIWWFFRNIKRCKDRLQNTLYNRTEAIKELILGTLYLSVWNKLYKRECWDNVFFPEGKAYEDIATVYQTIIKAHSVACTSISLYHYRMRDSSIIHNHSMKHLMDLWDAYYQRYLFFYDHQDLIDDSAIIDKMSDDFARLSVKIWEEVFTVPKDKRNYDFLRMVSLFVRERYPLLGKRPWKIGLRVRLLFLRHTSVVSFAGLHILNKFCKYIKERNKESVIVYP